MIKKILFSCLIGIAVFCMSIVHEKVFHTLLERQLSVIFERYFACTAQAHVAHIDLFSGTVCLQDIVVKQPDGDDWKWTATQFSIGISWWHLFHAQKVVLRMVADDIAIMTAYADSQFAIAPHIRALIIGEPIIPIELDDCDLRNCTLEIKTATHTGTVGLNAHVHTSNDHVNGTICIPSVALDQKRFECHFECAASMKNTDLSTTQVSVSAYLKEKNIAVLGHWHNQRGQLQITADDMALDASGNCADETVTIQGVHKKWGNGTIKAQCHDKKWLYESAALCKNQSYTMSGSLWRDDKKVVTQGAYQDYAYQCEIPFTLNSRSSVAITHDKKLCLQANADLSTQKVQGTFYPYFLEQCALMYGYCATGTLDFEALAAASGCNVKLTLHDALIPVPAIHTMIHEGDCDAAIDFSSGHVALNAARLCMQQGSITLKQGSFTWIDADSYSLYLPVSVKECAIRIAPGNSFYLSGNLTLCQSVGRIPKLSGSLFIDHGFVNTEIFNLSNSSSPLPEIDCALTIETKNPISVALDYAHADVVADIALHGLLNNLRAVGTIDVQKGILNLPYKPLYITKAHLFLDSQNLNTCLLDVAAANTLNNYDVTVHAVGTLAAPVLTFHSWPSLEKEQIISLLATGVSSPSLETIIPNLCAQPLFAWIKKKIPALDSAQAAKIVPLIAVNDDQRTLECAAHFGITDKLQLTVQKGLSYEGIKAWLEYRVSQLFVLRAVHDQDQIIGSELEFRLKF